MRTKWNNQLPAGLLEEIRFKMQQKINWIELSERKRKQTTKRSGVVYLEKDKLNFNLTIINTHPNNTYPSEPPKDEGLSIYIIYFPGGKIYIYTYHPEAAGSFSFYLPFSLSEKRKSLRTKFKYEKKASRKIPTLRKAAESAPKHLRKNKTFPRENLIDKIWNNQERNRKHKKPQSQVYQSARRLLQDFRKGKLFQFLWDEKFLKYHRIPKRYLKRRWRESELEAGIINLALMFKPGYAPIDKKYLPPDLKTLLYNSNSQKSMLLQVLVNGEPEQVVQQTTKEKNKYPQITELLHKKYFNGKLASIDYFKLCRQVDKLVKVYQKYESSDIAFVRSVFKEYFPSAKQFVRDFAQYITTRHDEMFVGVFNPGSYSFKTYLTHIQKDCGVNFETGRIIA